MTVGKDFFWMRLERDRTGHEGAIFSGHDHLLQKGLVTTMHTIKIADRNGTVNFSQMMRNASKNFHLKSQQYEFFKQLILPKKNMTNQLIVLSLWQFCYEKKMLSVSALIAIYSDSNVRGTKTLVFVEKYS